MANLGIHQTNFTSGELGPYLQSRVDLAQYNNSANTIQNAIIRPHGGAMKRPGTVYVAEVKDSSKTTRLIDFQYSNTDAYAIEMGEYYFRFFRNGAAILSTAAITNGTFTTDLTGWTDDSSGTGTAVQSSGTAALAGGAGGIGAITQAVTYIGTSQYTLSVTVTTNDCTYNIGTTLGGTDIATGTASVGTSNITFTPSTAGTIYIQFANAANNTSNVDDVSLDTPIYQIDHPYIEADLPSVQYAQSYDILYFAHEDYAPRQISRTSHSQWTIAQVAFVDGPYYDIDDDTYGGSGSGITLTPSATTGAGVSMTASASLFVSTDVGRYIRYRSVNSAAWGYCVITGYTSSTVVTVTVNKDFNAAAASTEWRLGSWSGTTGYPSALSFYEQRFVFAGSTAKKQTIWFSTAGNIYDFQPDNSAYKDAVDADTAMTYTIADNKANVIEWIAPQKALYIGTSGGIWIARASNSGEAMTPDNITIVPIINDGCKTAPPLVSRTAVVYVQRFGRKVLEIGYSFADDAYKSADLAILAEHLTAGGIKNMVVTNSPNYLVWAITEDGLLRSFTYVREQNVIAWARHSLGGTGVTVKSIASIPGSTEDELWAIVSRTINGSTVQYVEYLSPTFIEQDVTDSVFMDSAITYSGSATDTLTGLDHLEGETVQVFGDGGQVVATTPVTSGSITLADTVEDAVVGLGYTTVIETNVPNIQLPANAGPLQGKKMRIYKVELQVYRSYGGDIGYDADNVDTIPEYDGGTTIMGDPITLFTGMIEYQIPHYWDYTPRVYISHSLPVPFALTGLTMRFSVV